MLASDTREERERHRRCSLDGICRLLTTTRDMELKVERTVGGDRQSKLPVVLRRTSLDCANGKGVLPHGGDDEKK